VFIHPILQGLSLEIPAWLKSHVTDICVSHVRWHWTQQMGEENWNEHSFPAMVPTSVYDLYTFFWLIGFGIICDYRKWTCNWFFQIRGEGHVYTCRLASGLIFKDAFKDIYTCIMHVLVRSFSWFSVFEDREFVPCAPCVFHDMKWRQKTRHFCEFCSGQPGFACLILLRVAQRR